MIKLICLDKDYTFKDCCDLQSYLYSMHVEGDVYRNFIIDNDYLLCDHDNMDNHKRDDIISYIKEYMNDGGYCNFKINSTKLNIF